MLKTCRTCLIEIPDTSYCTLNKKDWKGEAARAELLACVPELQLDLVKDPVICRKCVNILQLAYCFKSDCLLSEKRIRNCLRSANLHGKPITLTTLLRFSVVRESDVSSDPTTGESFPAQPRRPSLDIEAVNDEHERTNDYRTSTANEGSNVMNSEVSLVDGDDENSITTNVIIATVESTLQPVEFQDKILGWSNTATCTDITDEVSQGLDNTVDDIIKEEHDLLTQTEEDEASSLKTEFANDGTDTLTEVSNVIDGDVKEKTRSIKYEDDANNLVDGGYEFPGDNDEQGTTNDYNSFTANEDFNVMKIDVSMVDGEEESERRDFVINSAAITEPTLQSVEFQEDNLGSSSTYITSEISQDFHNQIDDDFVKEEHELTFKTETDEGFSFKEEGSNNSEEKRNNDCKTGTWDDVKKETRSIQYEADGNKLVDEDYEFTAATRDDENFQENNSKNLDNRIEESYPSVRRLSIDSNYSCGVYADSTASSDANITEQNVSSVKKRRVDYGEERTNNCNLNEKKIKSGTVDTGFSIKECSVNLQRLHLGDLMNKSSFNANELLNLTSANSLQTTNEKPRSARHNERKNLSKHEQTHSTTKSFSCKVCKYSTTLKRSLVRHMRIHTGKKQFRCTVCNFSTAYKRSLPVHLRIHANNKPFQCNVCEYSTAWKQNLIEHIRTHTGEKPFQCNDCEYSAVRKQHLISHMATHTGEKPFQCNVCEYSTFRKQHLIRHIRIHTGEKPFQCNDCDYSAVRKQQLIEHIRTHTGEKPFQCNDCEYSAVRKQHLISHMRIHTGEKPFQCNDCEYSTVQKPHLIRHIRTHRGEKPFAI